VTIELDLGAGIVRWNGLSLPVPGLADAAVDPRSGRLVALSLAGEGRLLLFGVDGEPAGTIAPPDGYRLSHFAGTADDALTVVGQGATPRDGWHDWNFAIDARARLLTRAGAAY
jgi:hypothetical protein